MQNKDEIRFIVDDSNEKEELPSTQNKECDQLLEKVFEKRNFS